MESPHRIAKWQKTLAFLLALPGLIGGPLLAITGVFALVSPRLGASLGERIGIGVGILFIAAILGAIGCASLQVLSASRWSTPVHAKGFRRKSRLWLFLGPLVAVGGSLLAVSIPPAGILFVLAGILVTMNSLAVQFTGLPWELVFNALWKRSGSVAAGEVIASINPVQFEIGDIPIQPELISISPEYMPDGTLRILHSELSLDDAEQSQLPTEIELSQPHEELWQKLKENDQRPS